MEKILGRSRLLRRIRGHELVLQKGEFSNCYTQNCFHKFIAPPRGPVKGPMLGEMGVVD